MPSAAQRELAARVRADQQFWRELVDIVGIERMDEPGPMGDWSFRDLAAHLVAWRNVRIPMLEAAARGEAVPKAPWPVGMDDDDRINDWLRERDRDRSLDEILADYDRSFERLAQAIEALPEEVATDPSAMPWTGGAAVVDLDFTQHLHEEHLPGIRAWLDRRR
jgi:hypothetical protein